MQVFVLNGWAASEAAWQLCSFPRNGVFSYLDHLNGVTKRAFDEAEGKVILVGWSMGGSYALKLALANPQKIAALVLVATTPRMMKDDGWAGMTPRRLDALNAGLRLTMGKGFTPFPEGVPNPYIIDVDENLARGIDYLRATDLRKELEENKAKFASIEVFIFQAERDPVVRKENALFLASVFPQARVEMVDSAEHALPVFIPRKIDAAVASVDAENYF